MNPTVLQILSSLVVAGVSAWFGSWLGVRHALRKLRNEKAFERRLTWYEDTVTSLVAARDLCAAYAVATRQRNTEVLGKLAPQMGATFQTLGERANKVVLYAPARTIERLGTLVQQLLTLAMELAQTLQAGHLYEEFASRTDSLVVSLNQLVFDLAQEIRGELGIEKLELTEQQRKALYGTLK